MRVLIIGGGPAGLYLALLLKRCGARHDVRVLERNRPDDTFGWGVVFSDQTLGNLEAADPRNGARDRRRVQSLGRHRRPFPRADDPLRRPRLLRHRPQAAAAHPAASLRGARRRAPVPAGRHRRRSRVARVSCRHRRRLRRHQQPRAREIRCDVPAGRGPAPVPVRVARHASALPRVHVRVREDRSRLVPGACLPVRGRDVDVHRRDARGRLAARRPRRGCRRRRASRSASGCSRAISAATG